MNKYIDEVIAEFEEKFTYLPPKDGKQMYMVSDRLKITPEMLENGSIIKSESNDIVPLDNSDVRQDLKDFLTTALTEQERKIKEEIAAKIARMKDGDPITDWERGHNTAVETILNLLTPLPSSTEE